MSHGFAGTITEFLQMTEDSLVGKLIDGVSMTGVDGHRNTQIAAWREQIRILQNQLNEEPFSDWFLILEYEIPRRSRRPDAILLHDHLVFVVEFKVGAELFTAAGRWQVQSYCLDLRDFHAGSRNRTIIPVLCATAADPRACTSHFVTRSDAKVAELVTTTATNFRERLLEIEGRLSHKERHQENHDPLKWMASEYSPTPSIIEAAVRLYRGHGVRELSHRHAHNLDQTTDMLVNEVEEARANGRRTICFVTGIPGAGKTLTGLDVVHDPELRRGASAAGVFLSGNGPLVKVVREALVAYRSSLWHARRQSEHEVTTFIQNVHQFLRYHREHPTDAPSENVVVFDEAQRAWNAERMSARHQVDNSEASELLDIMERLPNWGVIIALVGGGQEIHLGEAGLEEWGNALAQRADRWHVVASPEVIGGGTSVARHRLFESAPPRRLSVREEPLAHLDIGVRSHRAQRWAEWVNAFLALQLDDARQLFPDPREFPVCVTRNLDSAREALRGFWGDNSDQRIGLIATSEDQRHRAYGLESSSAFPINYPFEKWFLAPHTDVRSSYFLEVAASEFECQGLELDWAGVCWGGDLTPAVSGTEWDHRKFRGAGWQRVRKETEQMYVRNRYRVLLTRARRGMVLWIPQGNMSDPTLDPTRFDRVYEALQAAGVPEMDDLTLM